MLAKNATRPVFIQNAIKIYPAQYYSRPALAPLTAFNPGQAQRNSYNQFKYTLQQMAVSPFSVNDKNYMDRVREQYNIEDSGTYDLFGNIGGFIGVGVGAALSLGYVNNPLKWGSKGVIGTYNPKVLANREARNIALSSKENANKYLFNAAVKKNADKVATYNKAVDSLTTAGKQLTDLSSAADKARDAKNAADAALESAKATWNKVKYTSNTNSAKIAARESLEAATKQADEAAEVLIKTTTQVAEITSDATKATKVAGDSLDLLKAADITFDSIEVGAKIGTKATGFVPLLGIGADAVSLGLSAAAFAKSVEANDTTGMWINGVATLLDTIALIADFVPGAGDLVSVGASLASAGITGWYGGQTIGRSLSPEGARAQANFFKNIGASVVNRPVSAVGNLLTMYGVSKVASLGSKSKPGTFGNNWANFWTGTGVGNFARSTLSMAAMRLVNEGTSWVEEQLNIAPTDPSKVNFTNGIGIWGDINDNVFGATLRKSQLVTIVGGEDTPTFKEVYEKSWGVTDKKDDIFASISFADVREAAGIDFKNAPIINSAIDIVGEVLVDPQNYVESYQLAVNNKTIDAFVDFIDAGLTRAEQVVRLKEAALRDLNPDAKLVIEKINAEEFLVGPDGIFRMPAASRKLYLKQAAQEYLKEGTKGLRDVLADIGASRYRGTSGTEYKLVRGDAEASVDILTKIFDDVFVTGTYRALKYTNQEDLKKYEDRLKLLKEVNDRVASDLALSDTQALIKTEAVNTMKRLKAHYGEESENILVERFMEDLGKDFTPRHLTSLYTIDQNIRFHTDVADTFASAATWLFMPIQKIFRNDKVRKALKTLNAFGRKSYATKAQSARVILSVFDVYDDVTKNYTTKDIDELHKAKQKEAQAATKLDELLTHVPKDIQDLVNTEVATIESLTKSETEEYELTMAAIEHYKGELKKQQKEHEEDKSYTFVPAKVAYNGSKSYVEIKDEADAIAKLRWAMEFEQSKIKDSGLSIEAYTRRYKDSIEVQQYEATKVAAADYLSHTMFRSSFEAVEKYLIYTIGLASTLSTEIYKKHVELVKAIGYYRLYINDSVERSPQEMTEIKKARLASLEAKQKASAEEHQKKYDSLLKAHDNINDELTALKEQLKALGSAGGEDTKVLLETKIEEVDKARKVSLTQVTQQKDRLESAQKNYAGTVKDLEEVNVILQKIVNHKKAIAAVEATGRKWVHAKDFDKETMINSNLPITDKVFGTLKWDDQSALLTEIEKILKKSGVYFTYEEEVADSTTGKLVKKSSPIRLDTVLTELPKGASLQVKYDMSLEDVFYGALADIFTNRSEGLIFGDTLPKLKTLEGEELTPELWARLGPEKQINTIIEMIKNLKLTDDEFKSIRREDIRALVRNLNGAVRDGNVKEIQIEDLNDEAIRRVVMSRIKNNKEFQSTYDDLFDRINKQQEHMDKFFTAIESSDELYKDEMRRVAEEYISDFNKRFKSLSVYKYIQSHIFKHGSKKTKLDLFIDTDELVGRELPEFVSTKHLKEKHIIEDIEQAIVDYFEHEITDLSAKYSEESFRHAKNEALRDSDTALRAMDVMLQATDAVKKAEAEVAKARELKGKGSRAALREAKKVLVELQEELNEAEIEYDAIMELDDAERAYVEARDKAIEQRDEQTKQDAAIKARVLDGMQEILDSEEAKKLTGVTIRNPYLSKSIEHTQLAQEFRREGITSGDAMVMRVMQEIFGTSEVLRDYSETTVRITPSMFFKGMLSEDSVGYYKLLKEMGRTSAGQRKALRRFAEYLYDLEATSKGTIEINRKMLPYIKFDNFKNNEEGKRELFIQQVMEAYRDPNSNQSVEVVYRDKGSSAKYSSTKLLRRIMLRELTSFVFSAANKTRYMNALDKYEKDMDGNLSALGIRALAKDLSLLSKGDTLEFEGDLKSIRNAVWQTGTQKFQDAKTRNSARLGDMLVRSERLHEYERKDGMSLSEGHYTVAYDVMSKLTYLNPKMLKLIDNIINYGGDTDSVLFSTLKIIDGSISEDYEDKSVFVPSDFIGVKMVDGMPYLEKKDGSSTSLYNVIYVDHVNIKHVRTLLNSFPGLTPEMRVEFEQAYLQMVDTFKDIQAYQPNSATKEVYMAAGGTEENWAFIENNPSIVSLFQTLSLSNNLKRASTEPGTPQEAAENYRLYFNKEVNKIYEASRNPSEETMKAVGIEDIYLNKAHRQEIVFAVLVLKSTELTKEQKEYLIKDLTFYNSNTVKANYSNEAMSKVRGALQRAKKELETATLKNKIAQLKNEIIRLENTLKQNEDVRGKLKYARYDNKDILFKELLENPVLVNDLYGFVRDTDGEDGKYVMARAYEEDGAYTYIPVEKDSAELEVVGNSALNLQVHDALADKADDRVIDAVKKRISKSLLWSGYTADIEDVIVSKNGTVILVTKTVLSGEFENPNHKLHQDIKKASIDLLKETNPTDKNDYFSIITISTKEFAEIKDKPKDQLQTEPIYRAVEIIRKETDASGNTVEIKTGKHFGEQPALVTTNAVKSVMPALFRDLERWSNLIARDSDSKLKDAKGKKYTEEEMLDALIRYNVIHNTETVPTQAFFSKATLSSSDTLKRLKGQAESMRVYYDFINMLKVQGIPVEEINFQRLSDEFFKHGFIKQNNDGSFFDLTKLHEVISEDVLNEVTAAFSDGTSYLEIIKAVLRELQVRYGDKNVHILERMETIPSEFIDIITQLNRASFKVLSQAHHYGRSVKNNLFAVLNKHYASGNTYSADIDELRDRNKLSEYYLELAKLRDEIKYKGEKGYDDPDNQSKIKKNVEEGALNNPLLEGGKEPQELFSKVVHAFKKAYDTQGTAHLALAKELHHRHKTRRERQRELLAYRKKARLNFRKFYSNAEQYTAHKAKLGLYKDPGIIYSNYKVIESVADELLEKVIALHKKYNGVRLEDIKDENEAMLMSAAAKLFDTNALSGRPVTSDMRKLSHLENKNIFVRFIVNSVIYKYTESIAQTLPMSDEDMKIIYSFGFGSDDEKANAWLEKTTKENKERREHLVLNELLRLYPNPTNAKAEGKYIDEFFADDVINVLLGRQVPGLFEEFTDILNQTETNYYPQDKKEIMAFERTSKIELKKLIDQRAERESLPGSVAEYLKTIVDKGERDAVEYFVIPYLSKRPINLADAPNAAIEWMKQEEGGKFTKAHIKNVLSIRRSKKEDRATYTPMDVIRYLNLPILNNSKKFYTFLMEEHFSAKGIEAQQRNILRILGIKDDVDLKGFKNARDLNDVLSFIGYRLDTREMYAFIEVINAAKRKFLVREYNKKHTDTFNWIGAWQDNTRLEVRKAQRDVKDLQDMHGFTGEYDSNVIKGLYDETNFLFEATAFVNQTNKKLQHVLVPLGEKKYEHNTLKDAPIRQVEAQFLTVARNLQRETISVFFKPESSMSPASRQYSDLVKELNAATLDMMMEQYADSYETVSQTSEVYRGIRKSFNEIMYAIFGSRIRKNAFIKNSEAGVTLKYLQETKQTVFWANVYQVMIDKSKRMVGSEFNLEKTEQAVQDAVAFFKEKQSLYELDEISIKAIVGYAMYQRFKTDEDVKISKKDFLTFASRQAEAKHNLFLRRIEGLTYKINATSSEDEVVEILFGTTMAELEQDTSKGAKETRGLFKVARNIRGLLNAGYKLTPETLFDTYMGSTPVDTELRRAETSQTVIFNNASLRKTVAKDELGNLRKSKTALQKKADDLNIPLPAYLQRALTMAEADHNRESVVLEEMITAHKELQQASDLERLEVYKTILRNHPELMEEYMKTKLSSKERKIKAFEDKREKLADKYPEALRNILDKRIERLREIDAYFKDSLNYAAFTETEEFNTIADKVDHLLVSYPGRLEKYYGGATTEGAKKYLEAITNEVAANRSEEKKLVEAPTGVHEDGSTFTYSQKTVDEYIKYVYDNKLFPDILEDLKNEVLETEENILEDTEIVSNIVKTFFQKVFLLYDKAEKVRFEETLKSNTISAYSEKNRSALIDATKKHIVEVEKKLKKVTEHVEYLERIATNSRWYTGRLTTERKKLENITKDLEDTTKRLAALEKVKVTTHKELLDVALNDYLGKHNLTLDSDAEDILSYLSGENEFSKAETVSKDLVTAKETEVKELSKALKKAEYDYLIEERINEKSNMLRQLEAQEAIAKENMDSAREFRSIEHPHRNTNLGTYKNLNKDRFPKPTSPEEARAQTAQALDDVVSMFANHMKITKEALIARIEKTGDYDIHNSYVDVLVTAANYMKMQNKTIDDEFIVFDMETIRFNDDDIPYQITVLYNKKGKVTVQNVFFNSYAFNNDATGDPEGTPTIKEFRNTQYKMRLNKYEEERGTFDTPYKATEAEQQQIRVESDQITKDIIKKVNKQKNNSAFVETFISTFRYASSKKVPVVTHNGSRFDMPNYETFIKRYANTLLTNFYYANIYKNNPDEILKRYGLSTLSDLDDIDDQHVTDSLLKDFTAAHAKILQKLNSDSKYLVTDIELKQIADLTKSIYRAQVSKHIASVEQDLGIHLNKDVKAKLFDPDTGKVIEVRGYVSEWLAGDVAKKAEVRQKLIAYYSRGIELHPGKDTRHDYLPELAIKIDQLLAKYEADYNDYRHNSKVIDYGQGVHPSRRKKVIDSLMVIPGLKDSEGNLVEQSADLQLPAQSLIEAYVTQIESLESTEALLKELGMDKISDHVEDLKEKNAKALENIDALTKRIEKINESIKGYNTDSAQYLAEMAKHVHNLQFQYTQQLRKAYEIRAEVNIALSKKGEADGISVNDAITFKYHLDQNLKEINIVASKIKNVFAIIKTHLDAYEAKMRGKVITEAEQRKFDDDLRVAIEKESGYIKEEWFNFKSKEEIADAIKELKTKNEDYQKRLDDFESHETYASLKHRSEVDAEIAKYYEAQRRYVDDSLADFHKLYDKYTDMWKDEYKKATFAKLKKGDTEKEFTALIKSLEDETKRFTEFIKDKHADEFKTNKELQKIVSLMQKNGVISKALSTLNIYNTDKEAVYTKFRSFFITGIKKSIENNNELIKGLGQVRLGKPLNNTLLVANKEISHLVSLIHEGSKFVEDITAVSILNIVGDKGPTSYEMSPEQFAEEASGHLDAEFVDELQDKFATRRYKKAHKNDKKMALMLKEDVVFYKPIIKEDGSMIYIFGFHDQINEHTQVLTMNTDTMMTSFNITYKYRYANAPLSRPREIPIDELKKAVTMDYDDSPAGAYGYPVQKVLNATKSINTFYKKYTKGVTGASVYKTNGVDSSFEAIKRALMFYDTYLKDITLTGHTKENKKKTPAERAAIAKKKIEARLKQANAVNTNNLHLRHLDMVDMSARMEGMFLEYVKSARTLAGIKSFRDSAGVYQGLADGLLSKFNSRVPGKVLNLIDAEFITDQLIDYDDETLHAKGIDLVNSPEGGMGNSFTLSTSYSTHVPFTHNINGIRVTLPQAKILNDYTSIGITNIMWALEDKHRKEKPKDYDNNIADLVKHLYPPKKGKDYDWDKRVVFLADKTLSTYDAATREGKEIIMDFTEEVLSTLHSVGLDGSGHNIFTPDVNSAEDNEKYDKDIYHKVGINLKVTFANDARAFEDVPLMDYDTAMAVGWDEGYKTWLGRAYGFKGAVKLVKGLYKEYGSHIVANADSVIKRGAFGALVDMSIHNIGTAIRNRSKEDLVKYRRFIASYDKKDGVIHKYLTITDKGKFLVKPNINYARFFEEKELFGTDFKDVEDKLDSILKVSLDKVSDYQTRVDGKLTTISSKGRKGWQGTLYVMLDSEHTTDLMANKAEVRDLGGIAVASVDQSGTVLDGVVLSISVLYPMLAKSNNMDWIQAFYNKKSPQDVINSSDLVDVYTSVAFKGIKYILDKYGVELSAGGYDVIATLERLKDNNMNHNIVGYIREYLMYTSWEKKAKDTSLLKDIRYRMAELNQKIQQEAHDKLVGKRGVLNSALFKRHVGGRQQLLANTELALGTVITNKDIWENNIKADPAWLQYEDFNKEEFEENLNNLVYKNGKTYPWTGSHTTGYNITVSKTDAKLVEVQLNRLGLIKGIVEKTVTPDGDVEFKINPVDEEGKATGTTKPTSIKRAYGWMLSMRSPVQDYNAVPLMKVIGFSDHQALEANKYLYKMIGGDNDGDTMGMILINKTQYNHLKDLDATKEKYYDKGYFKSVDSDYVEKTEDGYVIKDVNKVDDKPFRITSIDIGTSNVGKQTFGTYEHPTKGKMRIRNAFTQDELYMQAFSDLNLNNDNVKKVLAGDRKAFEDMLFKDEQLMRTYTNVIIRNRTGGYDNFNAGNIIKYEHASWAPFATNNGYADVEKLKAFVTHHIAEIELRYNLAKGLAQHDKDVLNLIQLQPADVYSIIFHLDPEDREYLQEKYQLYKDKQPNDASRINSFLKSNDDRDIRLREELTTRKVLTKLIQKTVTRVQGSKVGIEKFGGARKVQLISSLVLRLGFVNRDAGGEFLDAIGAYDSKSSAMTPVSLANALFEESFMEDVAKHIDASGTFKKFKKHALGFRKKTYKQGETTKTLEGLLKGIDDTATDAEIKEAVDETLSISLEMLYDAYMSSKKAEHIFTHLYTALANNTTKGMLAFFDTVYDTKEKRKELYPPVQQLIEELKTRDKGKLEPFELQWLKIQFFGAQQKEANSFFTTAQKKKKAGAEILTKSYAEGYLNEHIIGRKEFKVMSNKASEVIGVAKHQGSDQQTYRWLEAYVANLMAEVSKHNIRLTNIDGKRSYLSLAIAMDRNPFDSYDSSGKIEDEKYKELSRERKKNLKARATLMPSYISTEAALGNLNAVTLDNLGIQLIGRAGAHATIIDDVQDTVEKFVTLFEQEDINTERGLIRAAKKAEELGYSEKLLNYNIAGYKIRNFVDDYMFNFQYINDTLSRHGKDPIPLDKRNKIVKNATSFMEILYKMSTRTNREKYDAILKEEASTTNMILQSELEIDTDYYVHDDETGLLKRRSDNNEADYRSLGRDYVQEELSQIALDGGDFLKKASLSATQKKLLELNLRNLDLNIMEDFKTVNEVLNRFLQEYNILRASYYNTEKKIEALKEDTSSPATPEERRRAAEYRQQYNYDLIKDDITGLSITSSRYAQLKQELVRLENELRTRDKQMKKNENTIEKIDAILAELEQFKTKEELLAYIQEQKQLYRDKIASTEEMIKDYVFTQSFTELTPLIHSDDDDGDTIRNMYSYTKAKYLTDNDVEELHNNSLMQLESQVAPFLDVLAPFIRTDESGNKILDTKAAYNWIISRYDHARLVLIRKGDNDEGLLKRVFSTIFKVVEVDKGSKLGNALKRFVGSKVETKHKLERAYASEQELINSIAAIKEPEDQRPIKFGVKGLEDFEGIDPNLTTDKNLSPTLKEINIRSEADLQYLFESIQNNKTNPELIGFVFVDNMMDAYDNAYMPFKHTGIGSSFLQRMYSMSKLIQRLSAGFLLRNWIDTWNQLYSEAQQRYGTIGTVFKTFEIIRIMINTSKIKSVYQRVSLDRTLYLSAFKAQYEDILNVLRNNVTLNEEHKETIKSRLDNIIRVVDFYKKASLDSTDDLANRISYKQKYAATVLDNLVKLRNQFEANPDAIKTYFGTHSMERAVVFIGSMRFAEYFVLYDKLPDVFSTDTSATYQSGNTNYLKKLRRDYGHAWDTFRQDLFEVSAFMQTNAQVDIYQRNQEGTIRNVLEDMLAPGEKPIDSYESIAKRIDKELSDETTTFWRSIGRSASAFVSTNPQKQLFAAYNWLTADTENTGRIVGYMLDKYLHNLTFEQSVDKSLTRFFNYGQRSPLELNMIADIPYLSFPVRSVNNWIRRVTDPSYLRLLSDLLDGIYGQFADEDGQYNEFTRYQMANGWLPLAGGIGMRAGNGAFDVMQILTDTSGQLEQRRSPIGRMLSVFGDYLFSEERDQEKLMSDVIKQSAIVGFATRGINQISSLNPDLRSGLTNTPIVNNMVDTRQPTNKFQGLVKSTSALYWYDTDYQKYTPKKYDYSQGNGRYKYYENVYKDWFNKYGRMRKPKVDPYSLVKDIQWKTYVRYRRQRYMNLVN